VLSKISVRYVAVIISNRNLINRIKEDRKSARTAVDFLEGSCMRQNHLYVIVVGPRSHDLTVFCDV
jgi:hypothetical protein